MIQDAQVEIKLGVDKSGNPHYANMTETITPKVPILGDSLEFSLSADTNRYTIENAPSKDCYIDGTYYEAINGGLICASDTIGNHSLKQNAVGGRVGNLSIVYNSEDDEVIDLIKDDTGKVLKRRLVHALWSSDHSDGEPVQDNRVQLSFVAWDDENHLLEAVEIPSGDYKVYWNEAYNKGTLAVAQKEGRVLENYRLGGFAEDELLDLQEPHPFYVEATSNSDQAIKDDRVILVNVGVDSTATSLTDSDGNTLDFTIGQLENVSFLTSDINKTLFEVSGANITYNGVLVPPSKVKVNGVNQIKLDLSNTIATNFIYQGDFITLQGVK
jgi:hypothetical protein